LLLEWRGSPAATVGNGPVVSAPTPPALPSLLTPSPTLVPTTAPSPVAVRPTPPPTPARVVAPLLVLNNTRERGKAHRAAAQFHAGGWPISGTGNYYGSRLSATTVYYTPGSAHERAAAETLHRQFPHVERVAPRFRGLPGHGLAVVLTADYPA
jgi:hypothetical protein